MIIRDYFWLENLNFLDEHGDFSQSWARLLGKYKKLVLVEIRVIFLFRTWVWKVH